MDMHTFTQKLARVVREDIDRISSVATVARSTGISETTLHRRLVDGNFQVSELLRIAEALRVEPSTYWAAAEAAVTALTARS